MGMLPSTEIESELSYAYLHTVASNAGMTCSLSTRQVDNLGIDATIRAKGLFSPTSLLRDVTLDIQLKATSDAYTIVDKRIAYFFKGINIYNKLRSPHNAVPQILVVLYLPENQTKWVKWSPESLVLRDCAWWVSLNGAPESSNSSGQTVYIPEKQHFNSDSLQKIICRLSRQEEILYEG